MACSVIRDDSCIGTSFEVRIELLLVSILRTSYYFGSKVTEVVQGTPRYKVLRLLLDDKRSIEAQLATSVRIAVLPVCPFRTIS